MGVAAPALTGMTVLERIAARGLKVEWAQAGAAHDRAAMLRLLPRVAVPDARCVADVIFADPAQYGL